MILFSTFVNFNWPSLPFFDISIGSTYSISSSTFFTPFFHVPRLDPTFPDVPSIPSIYDIRQRVRSKSDMILWLFRMRLSIGHDWHGCGKWRNVWFWGSACWRSNNYNELSKKYANDIKFERKEKELMFLSEYHWSQSSNKLIASMGIIWKKRVRKWWHWLGYLNFPNQKDK
jgi:hypothetical protein